MLILVSGCSFHIIANFEFCICLDEICYLHNKLLFSDLQGQRAGINLVFWPKGFNFWLSVS